MLYIWPHDSFVLYLEACTSYSFSPISPIPLIPLDLMTAYLFSISMCLGFVVVVVIFLHFFLIFHISLKSIIQYSHFIISLHIKSSESIHVVPNSKMLFLLWVNNINIYMWYIHTTSIFSTHLSMDSYFDVVKLNIYF